MNLNDLFLYDKLRSYFLFRKRHVGLTNTDVDILLYCRFFGDTEGWVNYSEMRDYLRYQVKLWKTGLFLKIVTGLEVLQLVEFRERKGVKNKKMKPIVVDGKRAGNHIQLRLTYKGMMMVNEFDRIAEMYLERFMIRRKFRNGKLRGVDEEFKKLEDYEKE